jgi:hypothetical protein
MEMTTIPIDPVAISEAVRILPALRPMWLAKYPIVIIPAMTPNTTE